MKRFLLTACLTTLLGLVFFQSQVCAEVPAFAGNVTQEEWDAYAQWFETLPPEQKDWEELLQKNLGPGFYFPIYLKGRIKGNYSPEKPGDWGFVEDDPALPRVLLIGDSISRSYTATVRNELKGVANVHRAPANCGPASNIAKNFANWQPDLVKKEFKRWDVIYFNAGIHDRGQSPEDYEKNLREVVRILKAQGAVLIFARTTPCGDKPNAKELWEQYNQIAEKVMAENGIPVDDLDSAVKDRLEELQADDHVHYKQEGIELLGKHAAATILKVVEELNAETAKFQACPT
ncbi:MAG: SGNH/GDSL hydrolase family protein, partial [Thermoguttaceae bacterium]|nr:SGNH/GDSL hydrolase family protein [Thermoguttaceae bacterium]